MASKTDKEWQMRVRRDQMKGFAIKPDAIPQGAWMVQPKYDGEYTMLHSTHAGCFTVNAWGRMRTDYPVTLAAESVLTGRQALLVGELVAQKKGLNRLPDFLKASDKDLALVVFDLLELEGDNLRGMPCRYRYHLLTNTIPHYMSHPQFFVIQSTETEDPITIRQIFEEYSKSCEGVMLKRPLSKWQGGKRSNDWLKLKKHRTVDVVVLGIAKDGERAKKGKDFGSVLVGVLKGERFVPVGRVSSGLDREMRAAIWRIADRFSEKQDSDYIYLPPRIVLEIEFQELYEDSKQWKYGAMRHPKVVRLRLDKSAEECILSEYQGG